MGPISRSLRGHIVTIPFKTGTDTNTKINGHSLNLVPCVFKSGSLEPRILSTLANKYVNGDKSPVVEKTFDSFKESMDLVRYNCGYKPLIDPDRGEYKAPLRFPFSLGGILTDQTWN